MSKNKDTYVRSFSRSTLVVAIHPFICKTSYKDLTNNVMSKELMPLIRKPSNKRWRGSCYEKRKPSINDQCCGPDRITVKKQQEELERVAKTIPNSAPASMEQFANCAVLSLQSNPGWGFDKKFQFMDKLAGRSLNNIVKVGRLVSDDDIVITEIFFGIDMLIQS